MGHRYFLARTEEEAVELSKIIRARTLKKRETKNEDTISITKSEQAHKHVESINKPILSVVPTTFDSGIIMEQLKNIEFDPIADKKIKAILGDPRL